MLPGLALWAAIVTHHAGSAAKAAIQLSATFERARFAVGAEESLERKYRLEPGKEVRESHAQAAAEMVSALRQVEHLSGKENDLEGIISVHAQYLNAVARMFDAVDAGDTARATAIDGEEVDPTFDSIEKQVSAAADASRAGAIRQLDTMGRIQARVLTTAPVVISFGLGLVVVFWRVLRSFQCQAQDAILREADAARLREQRFRSLVQNAADVILICDASGSVTYQSPAAETGWGYACSALLGRSLGTLAHPDAGPALTELLGQLHERAGTASSADATRSIELQMQDGSGQWRWVQLILTNLLHDPAVAGVVATIRDIQERRAFEQQLTQQAFYDALTGLPNRLLFHDRLDQALVRAGRRGSQVGLLFLDLDNFKLINDSLGHHVGDELLVQAAARLQSCIRTEDTVARLGGDEFVVVLEHLLGESDAIPLAEAIAKQFSRKFALDGRDVTVTASIGIALGAAGEKQAENLLRNADVAMYRAKSDGKCRYVVFDDSMHTDSLARLELENDLRRAIAEGELRVHYQPIVSMPSGRVEEVEALVRWQHPERGLIPPGAFIPVAEETGLIVPLGQWVLDVACRQVAAWHGEFTAEPPLVLSVNLSPRQFQLPHLADEVGRTLRETGLPPGCLKLEITEGVLMLDIEKTAATLRRLKDLGIKLAIDDFGTGYSSLSYLKQLPLDVLKIDRTFVSGLGQKQEDGAIVRTIISLAKSLDLTVTGEGIETEAQAGLLSAWGCDCGQGYLFGKPLDHAATGKVLHGAEKGKLDAVGNSHDVELALIPAYRRVDGQLPGVLRERSGEADGRGLEAPSVAEDQEQDQQEQEQAQPAAVAAPAVVAAIVAVEPTAAEQHDQDDHDDDQAHGLLLAARVSRKA